MNKNIEAIYPLTPLQEGMLFHTLYQPTSGLYIQQLSGTLRGPLNRDAFRVAWQEAVDRHAVLRTAFVTEGVDEPKQVVGRRVGMPFEVHDWSGIDSGERSTRLAAFLTDDRRRGFRMPRAPLLRIALFSIDGTTHSFVLTHHHILMDGWSVALLFREVLLFYMAASRGQEPRLPPPGRFADYIAWIRELDLPTARAYWREALAGFQTPSTLADVGRGADDIGEIVRCELSLSAAQTRDLQRSAQRERLTVNTLVQAAWALVLSRHTRQRDVVFGVVSSGRSARVPGIESMIGLFMNTQPLRADVDPAAESGAWLRSLQARQSEQMAYEATPLPEIQRSSELPPGVPLFDSVLAFENYPITAPSPDAPAPALDVTDLNALERTNYPLTIQVVGTEKITLRFLADAEKFAHHRLNTLLRHFAAALLALATRPSAPLAQIGLFSDGERESILDHWSQRWEALPGPETLDACIEGGLAVDPSRTAVEAESHSLSAEQLDLEANRLAHYLRQRGVGPEVPVGICMERSPGLMVALIAVLKAGGAYVPLDPDFPAERIEHMRRDSGARLILTQRHLVSRYDAGVGKSEWIVPDDEQDALTTEPHTPPIRLHGPDNLAYVIYTSGSTGLPKGAMNTHRAVCNRLRWMQGYLSTGRDDCVLQKTPISFDVSVWELFLPLIASSRLVLARPGGHRDAAYLAGLVTRFDVTTLHFVPSMLALFLEEDRLSARCTSLRHVVCSGEALPWTLRQRTLSTLNGVRLHNLYGPTEAAVDVSAWDCTRDDWPGLVPIGEPISNTRLVVLDKLAQVLPEGLPGELHIGGVQVGRGYWRRPALTAATFVPDPFSETAGQRMYRTGDVARWLPGGILEFLGRLDDQLKIGGVRVEPAELEYQLAAHAAVRQAIVAPWEMTPGEHRLAAYIVPNVQALGTATTVACNPATLRVVDDFLTTRRAHALQVGGDSAIAERCAGLAKSWSTVLVDPDVSGRASESLPPGHMATPNMLERELSGISGSPPAGFDLVILDAGLLPGGGTESMLAALSPVLDQLAPRGLLYIAGLYDLRQQDEHLLGSGYSDSRRAAELGWRRLHERALWLAPAFFGELRRRHPSIARIGLPHHAASLGGAATGYDAAILLGPSEHLEVPATWHDWPGADAVSARLAEERPVELRVPAPVANATGDAVAEKLPLHAVPPFSALRSHAVSLGYVLELSANIAVAETPVLRFLRGTHSSVGDDVPLDASMAPRVCNDPVWARAAAALAPLLRSYLSARVPVWLMPAQIVTLDRIPLSPSGKALRRALPDPAWAGSAEGRQHVAPRTAEERSLTAIWRDVLGVPTVGVTDNFFSLGGDSIRAIRVQARARRAGLPFSLQTLFETPRIADLVERIREGAGAEAEEAPPVPPFALIVPAERDRMPATVEDAYPLARMQAGMLFHSELAPETGLYHDTFSSHLRTRLDIAALRDACTELVGRHPALRTSFDLHSFDQPLQLVHRETQVEMGFDDLSILGVEAREQHLREWLAKERRRHYDWSRPGLVRFHVHARDGASFQFTLSFHHSVLDGWSVAVMLSELFQLYRNRLAPEGARPLPPAPRSAPSDLVALEQRALASTVTRAFWENALAGRSSTRLLRPSAARRSGKVATLAVSLSDVMGTGLRALAERLQVPLKSVLLAAHLRTLAAATGEQALLTGVVSSSRPERADGDRVLGLFVNNLPFSFDLRPGSWRDLVREVFRTEQAVLPHRRFPMAEVQRMRGRGQLFETAFNFVHFHAYQSLRDSGAIEYVDGEFIQETELTLLVNVFLDIGGSGLRLSLDYDDGELDIRQVEQYSLRYLDVLERMLSDSGASHDGAGLLEVEREQLAHWNNTNGSLPEDDLPERFLAAARSHPEAIALTMAGQHMTYATFAQRIEGLSGCLRARGIGPGHLVGICLERSFDLYVALLAVLDSGAAYVPLDPAYPADRIEYALTDAGARCVLTQRRFAALLGGKGSPLLFMDEPLAQTTASPVHGPERYGPDALAYVIYTSGSTGRPKGVAIRHRAVLNMLDSMAAEVGIGKDDVLLAHTTAAFDMAVPELYLGLLNGARTVLAAPGVNIDPAALAAILAAERVSILQATPTTWKMLLANGWGGDARLKALCGAEPFPAQLAPALLERCSGVWNLYGPTETTVWSTLHRLGPDGLGENGVPVGRPLANTQLYILDARQSPVPPSAAGALFIGGAGLAVGYHRRPALTAERFVPDLFSVEPGSRMYRTGDRARFRDDGSLDFLGRYDNQVKLRGFRIELGEIESSLVSHPGVRDAVAALQVDGLGEALIACGTVADADPPSTAELRDFLRGRLPDYMVPTRFVGLRDLPHHPNGKLDREAAVNLLREAKPVQAAAYVAPRTQAEHLIATIWEQVLGVDSVGAESDFFDLGGHSLSAIQTIARIRDLFRVELPLAGLFERPTPAGVVAALGDAWGSADVVEEIARTVRDLESLPEEQVEKMLDE